MADNNYPPGDFADRTGEVITGLVLTPPDGGAGYAYTFTRAHRPRFTNSQVEFQFFLSLGRTIAMEWKYLFG